MLHATVPGTRDTLLCPSSQPGIDGARVLGVVQQTEAGPQVAYLEELLPATPEVLAMAAPLHPTEVFRLAAACQTNRCPHFDGVNCGLATRIVQILPAVTDRLPACRIRNECRWFRQEGGAVCQRCPEISTVTYNASEAMQSVVQLPPVARWPDWPADRNTTVSTATGF